MLIGNAPCSWGIFYPTGNRYTWEQYLDQVAAAGYRGTELGPFGFLPTDPERLRDELARRDLALIGAAHVHTLGDPGSARNLMATLKELATLLRAVGSAQLILMDESNFYPRNAWGVLDQSGWRALTSMVRDARMLLSDHGVTLTFHPHVGTAVEREAQIDRLLDETEVDLCFDVGHHAFWGQEPLAYMQKVWERVGYVHLKNVDSPVRQRVLEGTLHPADAFAAGAMCPLPDGVVDIKAVVKLLESKAYVGPVVVEQDPSDNPADVPLELAARNRRFLEAA